MAGLGERYVYSTSNKDCLTGFEGIVDEMT